MWVDFLQDIRCLLFSFTYYTLLMLSVVECSSFYNIHECSMHMWTILAGRDQFWLAILVHLDHIFHDRTVSWVWTPDPEFCLGRLGLPGETTTQQGSNRCHNAFTTSDNTCGTCGDHRMSTINAIVISLVVFPLVKVVLMRWALFTTELHDTPSSNIDAPI